MYLQDGKSADLPESSTDQDLEKWKTNRLRRRKHRIYKLAIVVGDPNIFSLLYLFGQIFPKTIRELAIIECQTYVANDSDLFSALKHSFRQMES